MEIRIGDTVTLKKGGPNMTVDYIIGHSLTEDCEVYYAPGIERGSVICIWKSDEGEMKGMVYKPEDLELVYAAPVLCTLNNS